MDRLKQQQFMLVMVTLLGLAGCTKVKEVPASKGSERPSQGAAQVADPSAAAVPVVGDDKESSPRNLSPEQNRRDRASAAYFGELDLPFIDKNYSPEKKAKHSIVLLVMDALNARHLGIYGYSRNTSPHLDQMARDGLLLTNYISNSSWTRPSFTTILTGLPKKEHGVELDSRILEPEIKTLAERMRSHGYQTAGFVGNPLVRQIWGFGQGFQVYQDTHSLDRAFPSDRILVDKAIEWMNSQEAGPVFLMLFLTSAHTPYRPPKGYRKFLEQQPKGQVIEYPFREYEKPLPADDHNRIVAAYDDEIFFMDKQIGRLVAFMEEKFGSQNVSFIATADHGEAFGEHNCYQHTYHMWEATLRVPFILYSKRLGIKGRIDDRPYTHLDVLPTVLDLAQVGYDAGKVPGRSIVKALEKVDAREERAIFSQYSAHGIRRQAIRKGRMKLVHHHKVPAEALARLNSLERGIPHADPSKLSSLAVDGDRYEFYDLSADPGEQNNIFDSARDNKDDTLNQLLGSLNEKIGNEAAAPVLSLELVQALEAAGYITSESDQKKDREALSGKKSND